MAAKIPLNKFRSIYTEVPLVSTYIYQTPNNRASIIINAQATNTTDKDINVTMWVGRAGRFYPLVYNMPIPSYDARSLITGRVVLQGVDNLDVLNPDSLFIQASLSGINLSLGWLETVNTN